MKQHHRFFQFLILFSMFLSLPGFASDGMTPLRPGITWKELKPILTENSVEVLNSIEDFTLLFDPNYEWFAPLMTKSRSLQAGEYGNPRAIFISPPKNLAESSSPFSGLNFIDRVLFFSINGKSELAAGDNIEIVNYDGQKPLGEQLEFRDFDFKKPVGQRLSEVNPVKCQKCHGSNPRLIHDPIGRWPGMLNARTTMSLIDDRQMENWIEKNNHPRFSNIQFKHSTFSTNTRLNDAIRIVNGNRMTNFILQSPDYQQYKYAVAGALASCENLDEFLPMNLLNRHQNVDRLDFVVSEAKSLMSGDKPISHKQMLDLYKEDTMMRDHEFVNRFSIINSNFVVPSIYNLRWIFESRGLGIAHWFSGVQEGFYQSSQDFIGLGPLMTLVHFDSDLKFVEDLPRLDKLAKNESNEVKIHQQRCNTLKDKSLIAFEQKDISTPIRPQLSKMRDSEMPLDHFTDSKKITKSCTSCHSGFLADYSGPTFSRKDYSYPVENMVCAHCHSDKTQNRVGPYIPFADQEEMEELLTSDPSLAFAISGRLSIDSYVDLSHMPPVYLLPESDRIKLLEYFDYYKTESHVPIEPKKKPLKIPFGNL